MNCPNCQNPLLIPPILVVTHVQPQIDCATGEPFIPVARVVNDQVTKLWPEDYICIENLSKYQSLSDASVFDLERELKG